MAGPGGPTVGRVNIRVAPDTSRFRRELGQSLEALERSLTVQIPTRIDTRRVAQDAARVKADVERQLGTIRTGIQVNADTAQARAQMQAAARDRTATIHADIDRSSLARVQSALTGLSRGAGRLVGGAAGVTALAGALSSLAAGASAAVVPVVQLGTALAPAVGILTTLPAAAGTAAAAVAPLAIALSGMGDALGAAITGDTEALSEAMESLAPAAQDVVRAVSDMRPALADIRAQVQEGFFRPLVGPVQELGERLLPVLGRGLTRVSMALGESTAELTGFIGQSRNLTGIDLLFASTARSVQNASGVLPGLLAGFRELGIVGLPFIERAATAASEAAEGFARWAANAAESGRATQWIESAIDVFSQLGDIASNVGGIIGSIFRAAGDGGLLGTIERLTSELDDFFASAEGGAALEGVFEGLASVGSALSPVITSLASGIGTLAPIVGRLAEAFGPILTRAIDGLVPALAELEPGLMAVMDGLGEGVDALVSSGALESLGAALSAIMVAVSPLLPVLGELAATLAGALADALIAIAPSLELVATELAENLAPVLPQLSEAFGELVEALAPLIPPLVEALVPVLEILPELILYFTEQMGAATEMISRATPVIEFLIEVLGFLVSAAVNVATWILWLGQQFWSFSDQAHTIGTRVGTAFREMRDRVVGFLVGLHNRAVSLVAGIVRYFTAHFDATRDRVVAAFTGMVSGVRQKISDLVTVASRIPYAIRVAVGNLGNLLRQAGRNVIIGLQNGIWDKIPALRSQMSSVASTIRAYLPFSPAKVGPLRAHPPDQAGETITRMIADGLERGRRIVADATSNVAVAATLDPVAAGLPAGGVGAQQATAEAQVAMLSRLLEAVREQRGDIVLEVDSQEIARASERGQRQMARR